MRILVSQLSLAAAAVVVLVGAGCNRTETATPPAPAAGSAIIDDERLTTYVQARFQTDPELRHSNVDVRVENGTVTLHGTVPDTRAREHAVEIARQVSGVRSVEDQLRVAESGARDADRTKGSPTAGSPVADRAMQDERSPSWITTKIQAQFFASDEIRPWNIDVTTNSNGIVTLRGEVEDASDRDEAVRIARATEGVTRVDNELRVRGAEPGATATENDLPEGETPDGWVTAKVQAKFFVDPDVKGRNIDVDTREGAVTLTGEVESEAERRKAVAIARNTDGVRSVTDQLRIEPAETAAATPGAAAEPDSDRRVLDAIDDAWVTTKVQAQYFLDQTIKGRDIDVDTRQGVVTLQGTVETDVERDAAVAIARETEGVAKVVNQLKVEAPARRD